MVVVCFCMVHAISLRDLLFSDSIGRSSSVTLCSGRILGVCVTLIVIAQRASSDDSFVSFVLCMFVLVPVH